MHELRSLAEPVDHGRQHAVDVTVGARAALHRQPERLVQHEDVLVLEQDHAFDQRAVGVGDVRVGAQASVFVHSLWRIARDLRHANGIVHGDAGIRLDAAAVDADLPRPQQLLQIAIADVREMDLEPAVEPEIGLLRQDRDGLDPAGLGVPSLCVRRRLVVGVCRRVAHDIQLNLKKKAPSRARPRHRAPRARIQLMPRCNRSPWSCRPARSRW